jgi:hypothetical protein
MKTFNIGDIVNIDIPGSSMGIKAGIIEQVDSWTETYDDWDEDEDGEPPEPQEFVEYIIYVTDPPDLKVGHGRDNKCWYVDQSYVTLGELQYDPTKQEDGDDDL